MKMCIVRCVLCIIFRKQEVYFVRWITLAKRIHNTCSIFILYVNACIELV